MKTLWNKATTAMPLLLGVAAFLAAVGPRALIPDNIAWLSFGDPAQHYLGWHFFRYSDWSFPIGLNPDYGLELSNAIVFTDSNPLLAFLFKPFSPVLPEPFQYFGLWLLACFVLQAWLAWKLVGLISKHPVIRLLGTGLFVFAPSMFWRIQIHINLTGHFLVLAALYLSLRPTRRQSAALWALVLGVAALVHAYLLATVAVLWLADLVRGGFQGEGSARSAALEFVGVSALVGLVCWQAGYFTVVGKGATLSGYGYRQTNLLSVLDADGWSYVLKDMAEKAQYEGFNYLGLGVILLALFALPALLAGRTGLWTAVRQRVFFTGALAGILLFALSPNIGIGSLQLELPLVRPLLRAAHVVWPLLYGLFLAGMFIAVRRNRSGIAVSLLVVGIPLLLAAVRLFPNSGRMFWPVFYVLVLTILFVLVRGNRPRTLILLLAIAFAVQVMDTRAGWREHRNRLMVKPATEWVTPLQDPFWAQAASRYQKVRWLPPVNRHSRWLALSAYAAKHGLATDAIHLARLDLKAFRRAREKALATLNTGRYDADSLYVVDPEVLASAVLHINPETDLLARIDGLNLVAPGWKLCRACGHLDNELRLADVLPVVGIGERMGFSKSGSGVPYLAGGWADSESWGTRSDGQAADLVLPIADQGVRGIRIEANAPGSSTYPEQAMEIRVNGILATTVGLGTSAIDPIQVPLPAAARERLRKYGTLRLEFRFPDTLDPKAIRAEENAVGPIFSLLAVTFAWKPLIKSEVSYGPNAIH